MSSARDLILADIRAPNSGAGSPARTPPGYRRTGDRSREQLVELFCERVDDYRATVTRVPERGLAEAIVATAHDRRAQRMVTPAGLPAGWIEASELSLVSDDGTLTAVEIDRLDGVVSGCTVAIAETGTIVLSGAASEGRRLLSLVPDLHICVVFESQIVGLVPEAIALLRDGGARLRGPITFISGPSATSDIELQRVEGVHGPRNLVVLVTKENR